MTFNKLVAITKRMDAALRLLEQETGANGKLVREEIFAMQNFIGGSELRPEETLLQHLCSLTVAERETILRVAEISALLKRDSAKDFQLDDLSQGAVALVLNAETCLRLAGPSMVALDQTKNR